MAADLSTRARWGSGVQGGPSSRIRDVPDVPPGKSGTSLLAEMFDGDNAPWNGQPGQMSAEVAQVQSSHVFPYGQPRYIRFWLRVDALANQPSNNWHFNIENHLSAGGTSAPWAFNFQGQTMQFVYTPVGWDRKYPAAAQRPVRLGQWVEVVMGCLPRTDSSGWFEVHYDGVKVWEVRNTRTIAVAQSTYLKIGWYRPSGISGRDACLFHDLRVHDSFPGATLPPPPQPSGDTVKPGVVITSPLPESVHSGLIDVAVSVSDTSPIRKVIVGLSADPRPPATATGTAPNFTADLTAPAEPGRRWIWAEATDAAGNVGLATAVPINVQSEPPPPPPPPPLTCEEKLAIANARIAELEAAG